MLKTNFIKPILLAALLSFFPLAALPQAYGNWLVGKLDGGVGEYAATINDSQSGFGMYCYTDTNSCAWLLAVDVDCKQGNTYPVLVNADGGSEQLTLVCSKNSGPKPRYIFADFDKINAVIKTSRKYVGFAFPLDSGMFEVSRFTLEGSNEAISEMRASFSAGKSQRKGRGGKDYKM